MIKRKYWNMFYKSILLTLIFLLASEPVLVAAKPQEVNPRQEAIDALTASGDLYLTNAGDAVVLGTELIRSISAIQSTPLTQISENAVAQTRANALKAAEASAITLGSIDDFATSIESFGSNLPAAFDPFQKAAEGLPQETRNSLIQEVGLTSAEVDAISSGMNDQMLARRSMATNGMPADMAAQLSTAGFSQAEIDQIAVAIGTRGLANTSLTTRLAQFRASQDEWADARTQLLILNIQLMGYQIGVRQANGVEPRVVTEAELKEITQDELRLLVHIAHLQEMWGTDPNLEKGEGDWWFIEHYAGRAAERLDALVIDSQNRGLVLDLFVLQETKLLALSAKNGDAQYVKTELDVLGKQLSYLVGNETFISKQRDELHGLGYIAARLINNPNVREKVQWPIDEEARSGAAKNARMRMDTMGVEDLAPQLGVIAEQNETNNTKTLVFIAGLSFFYKGLTAFFTAIRDTAVDINQQSLLQLTYAVLSGDTSNKLLLSVNFFLGFIPVINVIVDAIAIGLEDEPFIQVLLIFGLACDIGESAAILSGLIPLAGAAIGRATTKVIGALFRSTDNVIFKAILNGLKLSDGFKAVTNLMEVPSKHIATGDLDELIRFLDDFFTGEMKFWDNYVAYVSRVGPTNLLKYGFDEGGVFVGRVLKQGINLSDEAILATRKIGKELADAGVELSDDALRGMGNAANMMKEGEFRSFIAALGACVTGSIPGGKFAKPVASGVPICDQKRFKDAIKLVVDSAELRHFVAKIRGADLAEILLRYQAEPAQFQFIVEQLGKKGVVTGDTIYAALDAGRAVGKGAEAVRALAGWATVVDLNDPAIAKLVTKRAGSDAIALEKIKSMVSSMMSHPGTIYQDQIDEITEKFITDLGNDYIVLGKWDKQLSGGYALEARRLNATFWFPHPELWKELEQLDNLPSFVPSGWPAGKKNRDYVFWLLDEAAIAKNADTGKVFKYTLEAAPTANDEKFLKELLRIGKPTPAQFKTAFEGVYGIGASPDDRIKELQILIENGYEVTKDSSGLYVFKP